MNLGILGAIAHIMGALDNVVMYDTGMVEEWLEILHTVDRRQRIDSDARALSDWVAFQCKSLNNDMMAVIEHDFEQIRDRARKHAGLLVFRQWKSPLKPVGTIL